MIHFDEINRIALLNLESLLKEWLPNGKKVGHEWICGDWQGNKGKSLSVNIRTGRGSDFASNEPVGDPIGIYTKIFNTDRIEAAKQLSERLGIVNYAKQQTQNIETKQDDTDIERQEKLDKIISEAIELPKTPAVTYLKSRGITGAPLNQFKFRPNKNRGGGSLVCIAYDDNGLVKAVQSIYLDAQGQKANFEVKKRTNGFPAGHPIKIKSNNSQSPILLTEGPEDALTLAQVTGFEVWCTMGLAFMNKVIVPNNRTLIVVRDNDEVGSKADELTNKILAEFLDKDIKQLLCARPPEGIKDSNQLLQELGADSVMDMINNAKPVQDARLSVPEPTQELYEEKTVLSDKDKEIFTKLSYMPKTDIGNSQRIVARFGHIVKYVPGIGWMIYEKGLWNNRHSDLRVINMAKKMALDIIKETEYVEEHQKSSVKHWCKKSQEGGRISYALKLSQPDLYVDIDTLDKDKMYFNCQNGVIDLKTGKLLKHNPDFYCTKQSKTIFDKNAKCPTWNKFLKEVLKSDDMISFIQRAIGYSLSGDTREQCMFVLHGYGSNGKSTFLDTIQFLMNNYHVTTKSDAFMETGKYSDANPFLAMLRSARFVTASETKADRALDETLIKNATGDTTITVRNLHQNPFQFNPQFKIWFATNHKPEIRGTDDGIWRRLILIPFETKFYDTSDPDAPLNGPFKDKLLLTKLKEELPGILNWAIEGCLEWQRQGLNPPDIVRNATQEYRSEMDILGSYLEENTVISVGEMVPCARLYENYKQWCQDAGHVPYSKNKLGRRLYERHITKGKTSRDEKAYVGIKLIEKRVIW